jgi:hypothetical protein
MEIKNEFIPYEQALALKELGFDEPCLAHWYNETPTNSEGQCLVYYKKPWDNQKIINGVIRDYYFAPTYSQAFRWFREKYGLHAWIINAEDNRNVFKPFFRGDNIHDQHLVDFYNTYEEAELACLIKLIELVKNK